MIKPLFTLKTLFLSLLAISSTLSATQGSHSALIPKRLEKLDFRPSENFAVGRSQLACISNTGDAVIAPTAKALASVQNQLFKSFGYTPEATPCCFFQPLFEIKAGYFFFSNSKMRKIYNRGGLDIQLCASYPVWNLTSRWALNAYGAVEYFHRSGKSINGHEKTSLWSVPINIGLKPAYAINANMQYYFAIGPRYFYIHQHNDSSYIYKNKSKNGLGFFVNTGFIYALSNHFVIDIFGEYSYAKMHFHGGKPLVYTKNTQIGGLTFGGGLGYKF